jgi:hypothetical protein
MNRRITAFSFSTLIRISGDVFGSFRKGNLIKNDLSRGESHCSASSLKVKKKA